MKEQFKNSILEYIKSKGFELDNSQDEVYETYIKTITVPGQLSTMIINGRQMQQQGPPITLKYICDIWGFGSIDDNEFLEIGFIVYHTDEIVTNFIDCFYLDEFEFFKEIFNKIFNR